MPPYKLAWFRDPDFRRAVLIGLDRPGLVKAVYFGRAQPLDAIISPVNPKWHNPDTVRYPYDPEQAKALLEQSGFVLGSDGVLRDAEGHPVEFELLASEGSQTATGIGTTLIENMRVLGIKVTLSMLDFGTLVNRVSDTFDYDAAMMGFTGGGGPSGGKAIYRSDGRIGHRKEPSALGRSSAPARVERDVVPKILALRHFRPSARPDLAAPQAPSGFLRSPREIPSLFRSGSVKSGKASARISCSRDACSSAPAQDF